MAIYLGDCDGDDLTDWAAFPSPCLNDDADKLWKHVYRLAPDIPWRLQYQLYDEGSWHLSVHVPKEFAREADYILRFYGSKQLVTFRREMAYPDVYVKKGRGWHVHPEICLFRQTAEDFCDLVTHADRFEKIEWLRQMVLLLARLTTQVHQLPDTLLSVKPACPEDDLPIIDLPVADEYRYVEPDSGIRASLYLVSEDLLDIYQVLQAGLNSFDLQHPQTVAMALRLWKSEFRETWGPPAVRLLSVFATLLAARS